MTLCHKISSCVLQIIAFSLLPSFFLCAHFVRRICKSRREKGGRENAAYSFDLHKKTNSFSLLFSFFSVRTSLLDFVRRVCKSRREKGEKENAAHSFDLHKKTNSFSLLFSFFSVRTYLLDFVRRVCKSRREKERKRMLRIRSTFIKKRIAFPSFSHSSLYALTYWISCAEFTNRAEKKERTRMLR